LGTEGTPVKTQPLFCALKGTGHDGEEVNPALFPATEINHKENGETHHGK